MNRRGFLARLTAAVSAALATRFIPKRDPVARLSDAEVLENLEHGVYDDVPVFTTNSVVRIDANCSFIMGRGACGYRGPVTRCDKTLGSCRCPASFGGFPGATLGAPVYARDDGGATCQPENIDAAFLGFCVGVEKGSPTKPAAITVAVSGSRSAPLRL